MSKYLSCEIKGLSCELLILEVTVTFCVWKVTLPHGNDLTSHVNKIENR